MDISVERTLDQRFASLLDTRTTTADIAHDPRARRAYGSLTGTRIVPRTDSRGPPNQPSTQPNPVDPPNPADPEEWVWQTPDVKEFIQLLENQRREEETTQLGIEGERGVPIMVDPPTGDVPYLRNLYLRVASNVWNRFPHPWLTADGRVPPIYNMHGTAPVPMHQNLRHPNKRPNIPWESLSRSQQIDENDYQRTLTQWHNLRSLNSDNLIICGFPPPPVHWPPPWRPKEASYAYPMPRPSPWIISSKMAEGQCIRNTTSYIITLPYRPEGRSGSDGATLKQHRHTAAVLRHHHRELAGSDEDADAEKPRHRRRYLRGPDRQRRMQRHRRLRHRRPHPRHGIMQRQTTCTTPLRHGSRRLRLQATTNLRPKSLHSDTQHRYLVLATNQLGAMRTRATK